MTRYWVDLEHLPPIEDVVRAGHLYPIKDGGSAHEKPQPAVNQAREWVRASAHSLPRATVSTTGKTSRIIFRTWRTMDGEIKEERIPRTK